MSCLKGNNPYFSEEDIASFHQNRSGESIPEQFDKKEFGRRLKSARERALLSQEELANLVGINKITISYYENGNREDMNPSITTVFKFARVLEVSIDWLCGASYIPDIPKMTREVYREIYVRMMVDLLDRAESYSGFTKNFRYYKLPRRGVPDTIRETIQNAEYAYNSDLISQNYYQEMQKNAWHVCYDYTIEEILDTIFDDKKYSQFYLRVKEERDKELSESDLPF